MTSGSAGPQRRWVREYATGREAAAVRGQSIQGPALEMPGRHRPLSTLKLLSIVMKKHLLGQTLLLRVNLFYIFAQKS